LARNQHALNIILLMAFVESFDPVIGNDPRVLILGSMPGVKSLEAQQYYAHPRNAFWPILSVLFDITWSAQYDRRIEQFKGLPLVLWDVLQSCHRPGSLDSAIDKKSHEVNDIVGLLEQHPGIALIAFNGVTAEQLFRRHVLKDLPGKAGPDLLRLPSTSPAHAARSLQQKVEAWSLLKRYVK
jgi:TDG/mug DNA glycosylase family protein